MAIKHRFGAGGGGGKHDDTKQNRQAGLVASEDAGWEAEESLLELDVCQGAETEESLPESHWARVVPQSPEGAVVSISGPSLPARIPRKATCRPAPPPPTNPYGSRLTDQGRS